MLFESLLALDHYLATVMLGLVLGLKTWKRLHGTVRLRYRWHHGLLRSWDSVAAAVGGNYSVAAIVGQWHLSDRRRAKLMRLRSRSEAHNTLVRLCA